MNKINTISIILLLYFQNLTMIMKNQEASFSYFKYFEKKSMYKLDSSNKDNLPSSSSGYMVLDRERERSEGKERENMILVIPTHGGNCECVLSFYKWQLCYKKD